MNLRAFESVYKKNYSDIFKYAYRRVLNREDAEDITSETFLRAKNSTQLESLSSQQIRPWLFGICKNVIKESIRANTNNFITYEQHHENYADYADSVSEKKNDDISQVLKTLKELDALTYEIIILKIVDGMTFKDIASILNITVDIAKKKFYKGKKSINIKLRSEQKKRFYTFVPLLLLFRLKTSNAVEPKFYNSLKIRYLKLINSLHTTPAIFSLTAIALPICISAIALLTLAYINNNETSKGNLYQDSQEDGSLINSDISQEQESEGINLPADNNTNNEDPTLNSEEETSPQSETENTNDLECSQAYTWVSSTTFGYSLILPQNWEITQNDTERFRITDLNDTQLPATNVAFSTPGSVSAPIGVDSNPVTISTSIGNLTGLEYNLDGRNIQTRFELNGNFLTFSGPLLSVQEILDNIITGNCN